jgi:predicted aminopeptidase
MTSRRTVASASFSNGRNNGRFFNSFLKMAIGTSLSVLGLIFLSGCQMSYLVKSGYYQLKLLSQRQPLDSALQDSRLTDDTKRKIRLVKEVKRFAEDQITLTESKNYESFVLLDDRYVVYAVSAAYKDRLEQYSWKFPIVGRVPYKGYFRKSDAEAEREDLDRQNLDVMLRGVSAYSTLGWFADPLLSSMTYYSDEELVETVIHEMTHATLYLKNNADFNERLATFVGNQGMEDFYMAKEGPQSPALKKARLIWEDSKIFSDFISDQIKNLEKFYEQNKSSATIQSDREKEFDKIRKNFELSCKPRLKTSSFHYFASQKLNNAVMLGYKTYYQDLEIFAKAFAKLGRRWPRFIEHLETLRDSKDPEKDLRDFIN